MWPWGAQKCFCGNLPSMTGWKSISLLVLSPLYFLRLKKNIFLLLSSLGILFPRCCQSKELTSLRPSQERHTSTVVHVSFTTPSNADVLQQGFSTCGTPMCYIAVIQHWLLPFLTFANQSFRHDTVLWTVVGTDNSWRYQAISAPSSLFACAFLKLSLLFLLW